MTDLEDRDFLKMLYIVIATLTVFFIICIVVARYVSEGNGQEAGVDSMVEAAIIERIKPVGEVNIGTAPVAASSATADGKGTYTSACFACHGTGAAGAPIVGDKAAWKPRISQGMDTLFKNAINGFKGMPAKGGNASLSDTAVKAAVEYMVKGSQ